MKIYNITYKCRLLPNKEQEAFFNRVFGCVRFVWNMLLNHAISSYQETGKTELLTPAFLKQTYSWLKEVDSLALANVQLFLKKALQAFFAGKALITPNIKAGKQQNKAILLTIKKLLMQYV